MFHNTVDLAGLMPPPQLFPIESRSQERLPGQTSTSLLKSSSLAVMTMAAMVERLTMLSNGCQRTRSLTRPVLFTEPEVTIMVTDAQPWLFARTACHTNHASFQTSTWSMELKSMAKFLESKL